MLCFRKFPVAKKFMDQRWGGGYPDFPSKVFCLTVLKKFVGDPLFCHLFGVSKTFMFKRVISRFLVDFFCLAVPTNFVGEPFYAVCQNVSGGEKVHGQDGGGSIKISFEIACLTVPKYAVEEYFRLSLIAGIEKV